jgi:hypothetical protein
MRDGRCVLPPFGLRDGVWDKSSLENDAQMGVPDEDTGARTVFLRNNIQLSPPALSLDPKQSFVSA